MASLPEPCTLSVKSWAYVIAFCCILYTSTLSTMHSLPSSLPTDCEVFSVTFMMSDVSGAVLV